MVKLMLPGHLSDLVEEEFCRSSSRSVLVKEGSWREFVQDIHARHPRLAERVFRGSEIMSSGFAIVLNDEVVQGDYKALYLRSGDEMCVLVTIAGG
jgi:sulfur carrier protein ThiS